jgi:maltooligosyltrehalose trehalohydrolase
MIGWKHGAEFSPADNATEFRVWAPFASEVTIHLRPTQLDPETTLIVPMKPVTHGYWQAVVNNCLPGCRYTIKIDEGPERPDPASRHQPDGVHAPSAVVDARYPWTDSAWTGRYLDEYVIYELHVGTFTPGGTFASAIEELPRLKRLGITAVEVMPISQFPGSRNWGYDGVYPYAAADCYGGLADFQLFVDAAHALGIAVILDVVYNHLGPEGNYLGEFGPYFNDNYHTPWGAGINFDAEYSDGVRDFFVGNAIFWIQDCHVDALRLDAVHAIIDTSAVPFLRQLTDAVHDLGRHLHKRLYVIGENDRNDPQFTAPALLGGIGADSQWSDDFHHALHAVLTGENYGYYEDFGKMTQLAKAYTDGFVYDGCYSVHRKRHHGADSRPLDGIRFVAFAQNHDQVGNRPDGSRLSTFLEFSQLKLCAAALLTSPYVPLIFMGEELGTQVPFLYFVSHGDPQLITNVREGRAREFRAFFAKGTPIDPQSEEAFAKSTLGHSISPEGAAINRLYTDLLRLRSSVPALRTLNKRRTAARANERRRTLVVRREEQDSVVLALFNFSATEQTITTPAEEGTWRLLLHTEAADYLGHRHAENQEFPSNGELIFPIPAHSCILAHLCHSASAPPQKPEI